MIVYRCLTSDEILEMIYNKIDISEHTILGENTFKYEKDIEYKHFFLFAEHANFYKNLNRRFYPVIGQYVIPNNIINEFGFGFYDGVKTTRNNSLSGYYIPLPELKINRSDFKSEYLYKLESELYSDFVIKKLDKNDNTKYNEPIEEYFLPYGKGKHGVSGYLDYSYADIYYEMVYQLAKNNDMNLYKVAKLLKNIDFRSEIEKFFQSNSSLFEQQTKRYIKKRKSCR